MTQGISLKLSSRLEGVAESSTLKMNAAARELAAKGIKVVNLTAGEPDFPVARSVKQAAIQAIEADFSRYTLVPGIPELRKKISEKLKRENRLEYAPEQIVVSSGAKQAIFNFLLATVSPGDEVIVPAPYWVSYPEMVKLVGGVPVIVETSAATGFKMLPEQLRAAITTKTKALILNSPSNPTGAVYSKTEMSALADILVGTSVWVVSDEIYEKILFDGREFTSFASLSNDAFQRTVTVNGFSKAYSMTGWRLGYAAGPKNVISAMSLLQGQSTSNPNSVAQKAALAALDLTDRDLKPMVDAFARRRDLMAEIFARSKVAQMLRVNKPEGAFYFFLDVEGAYGKQYTHDQVIVGSDDLAFYLLEWAHVGTVPGSGFGAPNYLRLSFALSDEDLREGCQRIVEALAKLR